VKQFAVTSLQYSPLPKDQHSESGRGIERISATTERYKGCALT